MALHIVCLPYRQGCFVRASSLDHSRSFQLVGRDCVMGNVIDRELEVGSGTISGM